MAVTAASAPARAKVSSFATKRIVIESGGITLLVEASDTDGNVFPLEFGVSANTSRRIVYANGIPVVEAAPPLSISGIMASVLTTFVGASGNVAARLGAVDTLLQSNGIVPS